jgi:hypothetical protein
VPSNLEKPPELIHVYKPASASAYPLREIAVKELVAGAIHAFLYAKLNR